MPWGTNERQRFCVLSLHCKLSVFHPGAAFAMFMLRFKTQMGMVSTAQKCVGRDVYNGSLLQRAGHGPKILSIMITLCSPSGCGKTILLRQLKPLLAPYGEKDGEILFAEAPLSRLDPRAQGAKIGFGAFLLIWCTLRHSNLSVADFPAFVGKAGPHQTKIRTDQGLERGSFPLLPNRTGPWILRGSD